MNPDLKNDDTPNEDVPKPVGAPRAVQDADTPKDKPEEKPFDEAAFRERVKQDCITACDSWPVHNLRGLDDYVYGKALSGILSETVIAAFNRVAKDESPTAVLAEMLAARKQREEREEREENETQNDTETSN